MQRLEAALDWFLTRLFAPLAVVGVKKCSRCTVRTRLAQAGLILSAPVFFVPVVRRARVRWDMAAHPAKRKLQLVGEAND